MGRALGAADLAVVTDVYGAREQPLPGVTGLLVADAARATSAAVVYEPDRKALGRRVMELLHPGDLLLTLGAGDVTHLAREVRALLEAR
jgi:UDP-N-acetylmuramate--alanine ligase